MTAETAEIVDLARFGSRGWSFTAVWRMGRPGELRRHYRTSASGRGLWREHSIGAGQWFPVRWVDARRQWPRDQAGMEKDLRILFRTANHFDPR